MLCIFNSHKNDTFFIIKHVNSQFWKPLITLFKSCADGSNVPKAKYPFAQ